MEVAELNYGELEILYEKVKNELSIRKDRLKKYNEDKLQGWMKREFNFLKSCDVGGFEFIVDNTLIKIYKYNDINWTVTVCHPSCPHYYWYCNEQISTSHYTGQLFQNSHPILFDEIVKILSMEKTIYLRYKKYHDLIYNTKYLNTLTFLLCTKKLFPRDISKLIAQKIFFVFFGWSFCSKKIEKRKWKMELEELRLRWNEKKKECDELESRIRQIEQSVEELKNVK